MPDKRTPPPQPLICANCEKPLRSFFEIKHVVNGTPSPKMVQVCSILCLVQWGYKYGMTRGIAGLLSLRNELERMAETMKGRKDT